MNWLKSDFPWRPALLLVMLVGAILLTAGYDAGLPLYESKDERNHLDEIYIIRGLRDAPLWLPGYPPGILYVNYAAQLLVELQTGQSAVEHSCLIIRSIRIVDIFVNLMTTLLIALSARKLGGDWAGLLAALAWLVAPHVLEQNQFGFPQVYEGFFYLLALYTALLALEKQRPLYAVLSVLAGLGAVIFKYATFPVLALGIGVTLRQLHTDRRRWLRVLLIQLAAIVVTAAALLTFGSVGSLAGSGHIESAYFIDGRFLRSVDFDRLVYFLSGAAFQIGIALPLFILTLIAGSIAMWFSSATWQRLGWLGLVVLGLSHPLFMLTYVTKPFLDRNLLSSSSLFVMIVSIALILVGKWISARIGRTKIVNIGVTALALLWLVPQVDEAWEWVNFRNRPISYNAMATWANQRLPEETLLVSDMRPFIREWTCAGGITTPTFEGDLMSQSIDEWLADNVYYAQLNRSQVDRMRSTPEGRAYLERMTLLQQFPPPDEENRWRTWRRGEELNIVVYQLWSVEPAFATDVTFGEQVRLLGYDLNTTDIAPGAPLDLRFYWQPIRQPDADYNIFIHLVSADDSETILAQRDGVPSRSSLRPTSTWDNLDERFISRDFSLIVPENLEPGAYRLRIGLYDWRTGARLLTEAGGDTFEISLTFEPD
jgi:hypothetical protein